MPPVPPVLPVPKERSSNLACEVLEYEMQGHQIAPKTALHSPSPELVNITSRYLDAGLT